MYNVVKVVDLVRHFSASCQRHGLCDEKTFPQNFIGIIKELERCVFFLSSSFETSSLICFLVSLDSEFVRVAEVLSQCSGKTKFEQFKRGLARNDMVKEIGRCDRHMNRIFERFMVSDFLAMMIADSLIWGYVYVRLLWWWISDFNNCLRRRHNRHLSRCRRQCLCLCPHFRPCLRQHQWSFPCQIPRLYLPVLASRVLNHRLPFPIPCCFPSLKWLNR